jgi:hypothetical protein
VVQSIGWVLGAAHARAAARVGGEAAAPRWTAADMAGIVDRAIELAGLFEAVYLAYARA